MHFDERLDRAFVDGWLGNRQQFVSSASVAQATKQSVRVIDIGGLTFHYRTRDGKQETVSIQDMESCLQSIVGSLNSVALFL
jgi:hypothetical protein